VLPRRFLVPATDDYPKEWHGVDLPATVYTMRWWQLHVRQHTDRVAELNALGFVWERLQPEWNLILEALITYSALYGDVMVPVSFVVPHGDVDFPKATWGIALGKCVYRMRLRHDFLKGPKGATRRSQLNQLCFIWDVKEYVFEKFCATLVHYAKMQQQQQQYNGALFEKSLKYRPHSVSPAIPPGHVGFGDILWEPNVLPYAKRVCTLRAMRNDRHDWNKLDSPGRAMPVEDGTKWSMPQPSTVKYTIVSLTSPATTEYQDHRAIRN
jgi:hypothetical protein